MKTVYFKPKSVRDVTSVPSGTWVPYIITFDIEFHKQFELNVLVDNNTVYFKPTKCYFSNEFEHLFNFGISCKNYDENKVIMVTSPENYYKHFMNS